MNQITGQIFALITAACWAQNSVVYSIAGKRVGSAAVTHIRLWIAFPAMLIVHFIFTGMIFPIGIGLRPVVFILLSGLLGFGLADLFIFRAYVDLGPRETLVVLTLSPLFSTAISWFTIHEHLSIPQVLGIFTTILGVIWVIAVENRVSKKNNRRISKSGALCAFMGALAQALGMVLAKAALGFNLHPVSANLLRIFAGLAGLSLLALFKNRFRTDFLKMRDKKAFMLISLGAFAGPGLGIILTMYALSLAPVGIVMAITQISPILLLPVDKFILKKEVPWDAAAGTIAAIGGTVILFLV